MQEEAQQPMQEAGHQAPLESAAPEANENGATPVQDVPDLARELEACRALAKEHYDAFLRARAESENVRRRAEDDVAKARKFGVEAFAESLLPVMDSLEAALADPGADIAKVREGVDLTLRQLAAAFERNRLTVINPVGERFDPHRHQAISMEPSTAVEANHVISVLQKGWMISDRVLRPALVKVAQAA
jgi:molecular chaperone GrpE